MQRPQLEPRIPGGGFLPSGPGGTAGSPHRRVRRPGRVGASTVEFAVVGLVFFPLLLGIIEIGRGLMVSHELTVAAARGCRAAVIEGKTDDDVTKAVQAALGGSGVTGQTVTVRVNNQTANASTARSGDEITVTVSVPVSSVSWVPGTRFLKGNLSAQYTLARE